MQRKTLILLFLVSFAALILVGCSTPGEPEDLVYSGNTQSDDDDSQTPLVTTGVDLGDEAPDFTLDDTYGDEVVLSSLRGKPVLLFFWATGCQYCAEQYPRMQNFHETYADSLTVVGINIGDDPQLINAFMAEQGMTFPCLVATAAMQTAYEANSVPHALVLDADGLVAFNNHPGYLSEATLQEEF